LDADEIVSAYSVRSHVSPLHDVRRLNDDHRRLIARLQDQVDARPLGAPERRGADASRIVRCMPTTNTGKPHVPTTKTPPAFSRDAKFDALARSCTRFLLSHGRRSADDLLALIPPGTEIDYYGIGGAVTELEHEVASLLGKEAALFFPTGTMAQQATLRVHADRRSSRSIVFHPACHMETNEERGYQRLHGLFGIPVGPRDEPLSLASLAQVHEPIAALLLELPQRALGGTLPSWSDLVAQVGWARDRGAAVHLDGARLWDVSPYYKAKHRKSMSDIAGLFDTVYVSFYKGLGGIAGCCVAGDADVIEELSVWRTRHGGRAFGLWPYAASSLAALRLRLPRMPAYYRHALAIADAVHDLPGVEVLPYPVQSTMLHVRFAVDLETLRERVIDIATSQKVMTFARPWTSLGPKLQEFEIHVGDATLELSPDEIRHLFARLTGERTGRKSARRRRT
jgi:threonine aldolase